MLCTSSGCIGCWLKNQPKLVQSQRTPSSSNKMTVCQMEEIFHNIDAQQIQPLPVTVLHAPKGIQEFQCMHKHWLLLRFRIKWVIRFLPNHRRTQWDADWSTLCHWQRIDWSIDSRLIKHCKHKLHCLTLCFWNKTEKFAGILILKSGILAPCVF